VFANFDDVNNIKTLYLMQPITYLVSSLGTLGSGLTSSINDIRTMISTIRDFITSIIENIFSVFLNLIIEFQKIIISIKDMVGKMIAIVVTMMYVLDGSIKTMNSAWSGPPGQMVKAIGSCFHPCTKVTLQNGEMYEMESIPLGSILKDGSKVYSVMKIDNALKEPLYKINNVYVTGEHFLYDKEKRQWIKVKHYTNAIKCDDYIVDSFACLITSTHKIPIDDLLFWDWEDDILYET
jgi:hypothetical protein